MMFGPGEGMGILIPPPPPPPPPPPLGRSRDERVPLWGPQETRDFIAIRGELENDFTVSKRNKTLWEVVASRMVERGYKRTPDQCKCKWKNLVNRYKDPENGRQCPFFEELHLVFTERARNVQSCLLESETGSPNLSKKRLKRTGGDKSSEEFSDDEEEEVEDSIDDKHSLRIRKRKAEKAQRIRVTDKSKHKLLHDLFQQQQCSEARWMEMMERRALERQMFEMEWRQSMEKIERERLMLEQVWQEREDQRRIREESRTAKRDALLNTLLSKLIHGDL